MSESAVVSAEKSNTRKALRFTTGTIVSFSLTLLGGAIVVLSGAVPLKLLSFGERIDIGSLLFLMPMVALILAMVFEVARIAFTRAELPTPRQGKTVRWSPGRREG
jgi:hypothetical protein